MKRILIMAIALALAVCGCIAEGAGTEVTDQIPKEYLTGMKNGGTVEKIAYPSKDYAGDGTEITKHAVVYLPPDYDPEGHYDLLILCHGIGGNDNEWGFLNDFCLGRNAVDHLILDEGMNPLIIVMPNGRASANYSDSSMSNAQSFYAFGKEIRNNLIPYLDEHYATWGSLYPDDLTKARDHRAMAGLSMGGMQTINIGLCECLDIISAFGAFSAAPTSYPSSSVAAKLEAFPDCPIRFFYNICGTEDGTAYASAAGAAKDLPDKTDRVNDNNFLWQEKPGGHDFNIWNLGLYNFVRILNAVRAEE